MKEENKISAPNDNLESIKQLSLRMFIHQLLLRSQDKNDDYKKQIWSDIEEYNNGFKIPYSRESLESLYEESSTYFKNERNLTKNKDQVIQYSISHMELMTAQFPEIRFLMEPFFEQGTINMVSAPPNSWKSWLLFLFAVHIAQGKSIFNKFKTKKSRVMIINEEDSARLIQDRMNLLGFNDTSLPIFYRIAKGSKMTKEFVETLLIEATQVGVDVIIFDSLRAVHDSDENDSTQMQKVMDLFKTLTRKGITVIFTHHHRKKPQWGKNDDADASRGSSAINAAISGHLSLEEINNEDGKFLLVRHLKSKAGQKLEPFEIKVLTGNSINFEYAGDHKPSEKVLTLTKEKILDALSKTEEWLSKKDFMYLQIAGDTTLKNALKNLVQEGQLAVLNRKQAEKKNVQMKELHGKSNEKLYHLKREEEALDFGEFKEFINDPSAS